MIYTVNICKDIHCYHFYGNYDVHSVKFVRIHATSRNITIKAKREQVGTYIFMNMNEFQKFRQMLIFLSSHKHFELICIHITSI